MLEPMMYAGLGFLVGCLLMVVFIPLVHERAFKRHMTQEQGGGPPDTDALRISCAFFNTPAEIDRLLDLLGAYPAAR